MHDYHKIDIWKRGHALLLRVHRLMNTGRRVPADLRNQLIDAARSIPANVVEGSTKDSDREFARFLEFSRGSAAEVEYYAQVIRDLEFRAACECDPIRDEAVQLRRMATAFARRLREGTLRNTVFDVADAMRPDVSPLDSGDLTSGGLPEGPDENSSLPL